MPLAIAQRFTVLTHRLAPTSQTMNVCHVGRYAKLNVWAKLSDSTFFGSWGIYSCLNGLLLLLLHVYGQTIVKRFSKFFCSISRLSMTRPNSCKCKSTNKTSIPLNWEKSLNFETSLPMFSLAVLDALTTSTYNEITIL